ncbi:MAG TPA: protein kinase [Gemmatimonadales bacterium]|nr:protein kinase [Gemmatimonadales bacterium]
MKCFQCGSTLPEATRFCGHCGMKVADPEAGTMIVEVEEADQLLARIRRVFAGEYEVESELARGGMAIVYRATETALRRPIALKVLRPDIGLSAAAAERFKREAQTVASLDHSNIIPVYRVGQVGGLFHIAMKFVEGRSLDVILETQGALPVSVVVTVLREAARGLAFANDRGIVHRDVKAANILIDTDGRVVVSDFGVALRASDVTLTAAGTLIGTPAYMSPEQCSGLRAGPQSDQYSLAVVGFQMLAGSTPFHAETLAGIMQHHFFTPPPDLRMAREDIPPELVRIISRALNKDATRRFGSTGEMLAALETVPFTEEDRRAGQRALRDLARGRETPRITTGSLPALPDMPTLSVEVAPHRQRPARRTVAYAAAATLLLAVGGWLVGRNLWTTSAAADPAAAPRDSVPAPLAAPPPAPPPAAAVPPSRPVSVATGRLRVLTIPPSAEILVDGRRAGVGSVVDWRVPVGTRRLRVQAAGYEPWDTTIVVQVGVTHSLGRVTLRAPDQ